MFLRVGVKAHAVVDPHIQAQVASLLDEGDTVSVFSLSGKTKETYDLMKMAKKWCQSFGNYELSSIAIGRTADFVLQIAIEEFLNGASLAGNISQLYLCDILVQGYEPKNNVDSIELRKNVLRVIIDKSND